jgi:hypothetical protein
MLAAVGSSTKFYAQGKGMVNLSTLAIAGLLLVTAHGSAAFAQGEDSTTAERDLSVIAAMLPGIYSNTNQVYFDTRLGRELRHPPLTAKVEVLPIPAVSWFAMDLNWGGDNDSAAVWLLQLELRNDNREAWLNVSPIDNKRLKGLRGGQIPDGELAGCSYRWEREPAQFVGDERPGCGNLGLDGVVLSEPELWLQGIADPAGAVTDLALHRARPFTCYADVPGVGGGRDEPYHRYDGFKIHDRGGEFWFDTKEQPSRRLGVSLLNVDWQINNYKGVFTRDSLVLYVNELKDGKRIAHGYSFTDPVVDRLGINLKWMLAYCYMESNRDAKPSL